jgi:hypothetical protein
MATYTLIHVLIAWGGNYSRHWLPLHKSTAKQLILRERRPNET